MPKVNLQEKFAMITEYWSPKIAGQLNGQYVKLAKFNGEFVWHQHAREDELFLVTKGTLTIQLRDGDVTLGEGEFFIVPAGVEHKPVAAEEVHALMLEPISTLNTGNVTMSARCKSLSGSNTPNAPNLPICPAAHLPNNSLGPSQGASRPTRPARCRFRRDTNLGWPGGSPTGVLRESRGR